eukprot:3335332-Heterocapsa_arctica.AAC.2
MFGSNFVCAVRWQPSGRPAGLRAERGCADCAAAAQTTAARGRLRAEGNKQEERERLPATAYCLRLAFADTVFTW